MTAVSPSVAPLRAEFGDAVQRHVVSCGDTIVYVARERAHDVLAWLKDAPGQQFDYLTDVTAVEYRDPERPLEVVWQLRSLARKADLRVKVELDQREPLEVRSVYDLWRGADWLEREVYDMFGITFTGPPRPAPHPDVGDLRRGLSAAEGLSRCGATSAGRSRPGRRWRPIPKRTTPWKSCPSPRRSTSSPRTCGSGWRGASGGS